MGDKLVWGTVRPSDHFNAQMDCTALKKAMDGAGTDEKALINILGKRSTGQRLEIRDLYKSIYGKDLISELKSELSSDFKHTILALVKTPAEYDTEDIRKAVKGKNKEDMMEILCTRSADEIWDIKQEYRKAFGVELEKDVADNTSGDFKKLVGTILTRSRSMSYNIDVEGGKIDAEALHQVGEKNWSVNEPTFTSIMLTQSYPQLECMMYQYSQLYEKSFEEAITVGLSKDMVKEFRTIVNCAKNMQWYFAERLRKAMKGMGTDDRTLTRIVVCRSEIDMVQIKEEFFVHYDKTLEEYIKADTSGDYEKILMTLIHGSYK